MAKQNLSDVIPAMFFSAAMAKILTNFVDYISVLIDGIITSKTLGFEAYSAISLFNPLNDILLLLNNAISTGSHVICSHYVGTGDRDKANSVFSIALVIIAVVAAMFITVWHVIPDDIIRIAGVSTKNHPYLHSDMTSYVNGYMLGLPLLMTIQVIGPVIVMCVSNIIVNLVNGLIIHGGTFGMFFSTSSKTRADTPLL